MKDLRKRTFWGILFVLILIGGMLSGQYAFATVFFVLSVFTHKEFYDITKEANLKPQYITGILSGMLLFIISFLSASGVISMKYFLILIPLGVFIMIYELYRKKENPLQNIAITFLGIIYVSAPFALMNYLVFPGINIYKFNLLLSLFIFIWVSDSGAYLVGSAFGKHRLFERISPKKSWEGFIGGLISAVIAAYLVSISLLSEYSFTYIATMAVLIVIAGTFGDLTESMFKRNLGVKDSGKIIPGHGGLLDRLDSIIMATPVIFFFFYVLAN